MTMPDAEPEEAQPKFRVAISGGGIAGLTLALALQTLARGDRDRDRDIHVDIYEAAPRFAEAGAGVMVYKRPWGVLRRLGLGEKLKLGGLTDVPVDEKAMKLAFQMRKSDQSEGVSFFDLVVPMGNVSFHRADFLDVLASGLDKTVTTPHFSKRLASYSQPAPAEREPSRPGGVVLRFTDGSTATCDILVGADGIHSATRKTLLEEAAALADPGQAETLRGLKEPVWSGSVAYRAVVSGEALRRVNPGHRALTTPQNYMGKNKHLIVFPITHHGRPFVNIVAFCSWPEKEGGAFVGDAVQACEKEEVLRQYEGWEAEVQQLLQCIDSPTKWAINALRELPMSVHGRVVIIGDAAHAMTPHLGSGAGQAMEDAYTLAHVLAHRNTTRSTLPTALKMYESVRLPFGNMVLRLSRANGRLYEFADDENVNADHADIVIGRVDVGCGDDSTVEVTTDRFKKIGEAVVENRKWTWKTDVDDDVESVLLTLEEAFREPVDRMGSINSV